MSDQHSHEEEPTRLDRFNMWLFAAAAVVGLGLGVWALFFRA